MLGAERICIDNLLNKNNKTLQKISEKLADKPNRGFTNYIKKIYSIGMIICQRN